MTSNANAAEQEAFLGARQKQSKLKSLSNFLYDKEKGTFMGRTGISWLQITTFYIIFYACLAGFFAICLAVFMQTISYEKPCWAGEGSIMGQNPGVGYQPWLKDSPESTLIRLNGSNHKEYVKQLRSFLGDYLNDTVVEVQECDEKPVKEEGEEDSEEEEEQKKACSYRKEIKEATGIDDWASLTAYEFGYDKGQPMIFLTLNRMLGWEPKGSEKWTADEDLPESLKNRVKDGVTNRVVFHCEGEYAADKDNIGSIEYIPEDGISTKFFPYRNYNPKDMKHHGYQTPIAFVKFTGLPPGVLVMVECRAWDDGVAHDRPHKLGMVHFELLWEPPKEEVEKARDEGAAEGTHKKKGGDDA